MHYGEIKLYINTHYYRIRIVSYDVVP